uniref:Uncharacterized protein n=1 Tax=Micrurus surinamensis TaxID=129470 RepID=A0A2D4P7C7_MICSU
MLPSRVVRRLRENNQAQRAQGPHSERIGIQSKWHANFKIYSPKVLAGRTLLHFIWPLFLVYSLFLKKNCRTNAVIFICFFDRILIVCFSFFWKEKSLSIQ